MPSKPQTDEEVQPVDKTDEDPKSKTSLAGAPNKREVRVIISC